MFGLRDLALSVLPANKRVCPTGSGVTVAARVPRLRLVRHPPRHPSPATDTRVLDVGAHRRGWIGVRALPAGVILALVLAIAVSGHAAAQPETSIWPEFVDMLRSESFPVERVRPYREELREPVLGFLSTMREQANWDEWAVDPDVFTVDDRVHFVVPLTFGGDMATYCFSFLIEDGEWFFQHLEAIALRLDQLGPLPVSEFPDLPEPTKAWMRAEIEVSREIWLYNMLTQERGRDAALDWFRDGAGYALAARSWVPFVSPEQAFVLYVCWEQSNLRGNEVTLERLSDSEAVVRLLPMYFLLYERTAHLRQQIPFDEYRDLYKFRWNDRASSAGWDIQFVYEGPEITMRLTRGTEAAGTAPTLD